MPWWIDAVFYEIYVRSFQDADGDGIGDLQGITSRLDHLADLGIDAVWLTPFYPSPQVDFGYDVSDYQAIDPQFGTLADFDALVDAAHRRGIRLLVDLVINHTSDQHPHFLASRASRTSPYRDWYIWRDGRDDGQPPSNWESSFGGPAWTFDAATGQWYYHYFYAQQPDLNWRNPAVEAWLLSVIDFWVARGVDGFRLDAINSLFEDEALRDNPLLDAPRVKLTGIVTQDQIYSRGLPEVHDVLRRLRHHLEAHAPNVLLVSEAYVDTPADLTRFYGSADAPQVHLPFNFFLTQVPAFSAAAFRTVVEEVEAAVGDRWPSLVFNNHDIDRACDRYAVDGRNPDQVARLLAIMLLTLRGTPFLYYGDEIGMRTFPPQSLDEVRDPVGRTFWPRYKGRDGVRRPMAWDGTAHAGFTTGEPWLALAPDAATRTVASQQDGHGTLLGLHRRLLAARRAHPALRHGSYRSLPSHPDVFAYAREVPDAAILIVLNCSDQSVDAGLEHETDDDWRVAVSTHHRPRAAHVNALSLAPLEGLILAR